MAAKQTKASTPVDLSGAERCVIVTTAHRGVFFGELADDKGKESVVLDRARNIIRWSGRRGFLGLATYGPEKESAIGATANRILLYDITGVADCTVEAVEAFRRWPE